MDALRIFAYSSELIAAILATVYFKKYKHSALCYFMPYLWYVVLNEACAYILLPLGIVRFELTNIYGLITPFFVLWTCRKFISSVNTKRILGLIMLAFFTINVIEGVMKGINPAPWTISKIAGPIIGIIAIAMSLASIFKRESVNNPLRDIYNYFLLGFTLFFVASPVVMLGRIYFLDNFRMSTNLSYIMAVVVILMYLIFSFGFYWGEKITQ